MVRTGQWTVTLCGREPGKVTVGLSSYWPCHTDSVVYLVAYGPLVYGTLYLYLFYTVYTGLCNGLQTQQPTACTIRLHSCHHRITHTVIDVDTAPTTYNVQDSPATDATRSITPIALCTNADAQCDKAGIPRRRHGHRHRHGIPCEDPREKSRVSDVRMYLDVSGESESVSVSVSASWNASLNRVVGRTKLTTPAAVDVLRRNFTEVQTLTVWHKVPEGSIVISEDSRISLQLRAVVYVEGSLCAKNQLDLFHRFQSTEYRLVTDRQTDNHINTGCSPHSTTPTPTPTPTSSTRSSRGS